MGGRVLRPHVDHDPLVAPLGLLGDDRVPVLAGDGVDLTLGRVVDGGGKGIGGRPVLCGGPGGVAPGVKVAVIE